jgi:hypothetical protein
MLKLRNPTTLKLNDQLVAVILEEHLWYAEQYADLLEDIIAKMESTINARTNMIKQRKFLKWTGILIIFTIALTAIHEAFGLRTTLLVLCFFTRTKAAPTTILKELQNTLMYIRFRHNIGWISTGLNYNDFIKMEATLVALIQKLQQHPETTTATTTSAPIFRTKNECIQDLLITFVNKNLSSKGKKGRTLYLEVD